MNAMALFSLYLYSFFTYFAVIFSRTNPSHLLTEAVAQIFFLLFSVFLSFHSTRLRHFSLCSYTCILNNVGCFFGWELMCVH